MKAAGLAAVRVRLAYTRAASPRHPTMPVSAFSMSGSFSNVHHKAALRPFRREWTSTRRSVAIVAFATVLQACYETPSEPADETGNPGVAWATGSAGAGATMTTTHPTGGNAGTGVTSFDGVGDQGTGLTGGATTGEDSMKCGEIHFNGKAPTPSVALALDKSLSMMDEWVDGLETRTRWYSLYETVEYMVEHHVRTVNFGIKLFPGRDAKKGGDGACLLAAGLEVPFGTMDATEILAALPGPGEHVQGGTPALEAMRTAIAALKTVDASQPRFSVLVMDGRVSCDGTMEQLAEELAAAAAQGIPTYVIGIDVEHDEDDPDLPAAMNALAVAGGTENYFASNNAVDLRAAMADIVGEITSCEFGLEPPPLFPEYVTMKVSGLDIPRIDGVHDCVAAAALGHTHGWVYRNDQFDAVEICGASCEMFTQIGIADLVYGCRPPM